MEVKRNGQHMGICPKGAGKGISLNKVCQVLGIYPEKVLAIGDSQNDEDMLDGRYHFKSATVSNAEEEVKEAVGENNGYIAKHPLGKGVKEILQNLIQP